MSSPDTGRQHLARRSGTSSTPSTRMPYCDASPSARRRLARGREVLDDRRLVLGRLALLEALEDLVDDRLGGDLRASERDVEVVGLLEAHLADHVREQRGAGDLLRGQAGLLQVLLQ